MKRVRLTHLDGKLPNIALMRLAHWHRQKGDEVHLARTPSPTMFEPEYDVVYASAIFEWTRPVIERLLNAYPHAIVGGTGTGNRATVEQITGPGKEVCDYSIYPDYPHSTGFTQRGCRLRCGFCMVPKLEGKPYSVNTIADIHRPGTPRKVVLLDNDFFGQDHWRERIEEIRDGDYQVSFNQGINIRIISDEVAEAIASVRYMDDDFTRRRLYTAWDNINHERVFFRGLETLERAGVPSTHVMAYMLIGYDPAETMERILYRFNRLVDAGCKPYPMPYRHWERPDLRKFQRWAIRRYYEFIPWEEFDNGYPKRHRPARGQMEMPLSA